MASRRLLLVEDSSTMRRMLSTMLMEEQFESEKCFEVETANDGVQGLAKLRAEPRPELILTDYEMPELDGAGLCRAVKADMELRSIPDSHADHAWGDAEQDRRPEGRGRRLHRKTQRGRRLSACCGADSTLI